MKCVSYKPTILALAALALVAFAYDAAATPTPNGAVINTRIFNDCPTSVITEVNNYPTLISILDERLDCGGFANLHNWQFSEDGGATPAVFDNDSAFRFSAVLTLDGTGDGEGGLLLSPWWAQDVDGRFNVRSTDGEIACFGGRLPFYSFTANDGINYVKGTQIGVEITYLPNDLTETNPATIEYAVDYNGMLTSSGPLPFDMGNPDEDPPNGLWGILNDARAGGYVQVFLQAGNPVGFQADWGDIDFEVLDPTPIEQSSWGQIKAVFDR